MSAIHLSFDDHGFLFTDDQWVFANAFIDGSRTAHPLIALDYKADVFGSLFDRLQGVDFKPNDWECIEGQGWTFKLAGGVPKVWHASGNQGQGWMQRVVLPYSLESGKLGRPAPCRADSNASSLADGIVSAEQSNKCQLGPQVAVKAPSNSSMLQWLQAGARRVSGRV
jgi:hypothetical protein